MSSAALLQLASPALPIGAFSYSSGLESAIDLGWVSDAKSAEHWISAQRDEALLHWEIPLWHDLFAAWQNDLNAITELNEQAIAAREAQELRSEQLQMGYALKRWCIDVVSLPPEQCAMLDALSRVSVLTAHALAATALALDARDGALAYAFGFIENQVSAATKAVPLGQTAAQKMLRALTHDLVARVDAALHVPPAQRSNAAPLAAIASMKHETQYTRLFRS